MAQTRRRHGHIQAFWQGSGRAALCIALAAGGAHAQSASEVTPPSFQPQLQTLDGSVQFTGQPGTQAPPGADQIGITLSGVALSGGFDELADANAAFEERLTRGRIAVSELFDATAQLEESYADAGFVLARVVLPQQALRDGGVLQVTVVDGFVEAVETEDLPDQVRDHVARLTAPLVDKPRLTRRELERQLLLSGDTPGLALDSALAAGTKTGGTVIALESDFRPVTGFVGLDNLVPDDLGGYGLSAGFEINSPFKFGELFYGRLAFNPDGVTSDDPVFRSLAGGAIVPLGISGLNLNLEFATTDTKPDEDDGVAPTTAHFDRQSLRLQYPAIRGRLTNVNLQVALDRLQDSQDLVAGGGGTEVYEDRLTVLRFGANASHFYESGAFVSGGLMLSRGIDAFGARTAEDAAGDPTPLSKDGADAVFSKLAGQLTWHQPLGERTTFSLNGRFQTSMGDALLVAERDSIGGLGGVSAFEGGTLRGDNMWLARAEVSYLHELSAGGMPLRLSPYIFAAAGGVSIENATAVETESETARAFGVGLDLLSRGEDDFRALSGTFEFAVGDRSNGSDDNRFGFTLSQRF